MIRVFGSCITKVLITDSVLYLIIRMNMYMLSYAVLYEHQVQMY